MTDGLSEAYETKQWDVFCENNDLLLENDQLKAENAKLRELVRIAIKYCDSGTCDGCPIQGESGSCSYSDMARDLGIEVDA